MLTALQQRKVTRMFHVYDINRDGVLQAQDFDAVGRNIAEQRGHAPGSAAHQGLVERYHGLWEKLSFASGGKTAISLREFLAIMDAILGNRDGFEVMIQELGGTAFDVLDADRDGKVTLDEYRAFLVAHDIDPTLAERAFPKLDLDGDGHISRPEVLELARQFYYSDDPAAPGNLLYATF